VCLERCGSPNNLARFFACPLSRLGFAGSSGMAACRRCLALVVTYVHIRAACRFGRQEENEKIRAVHRWARRSAVGRRYRRMVGVVWVLVGARTRSARPPNRRNSLTCGRLPPFAAPEPLR